MTQTPGRAYPQTGVAAFTARQRAAVDGADAATPSDQLTGEQASAVIGDPIPLVFCNRVDGVGGVWISPPATEARFENDENDLLTVHYQLVLSDGELGGVSVVWQGSERRAGPGAVAGPDRPLATVAHSYDGRTGTWQPGNFITQNWKFATQINTQEVTGVAVASEAEIEEAKARVQLTSKSNYVTRYDVTVKMIDWGSRVPSVISGSNSTGVGSSGPSVVSTFASPRPLRNLGNWSFSRERSTDVQRIELDHVEDVYWEGKFIPKAVYRVTTEEESIEPSRIIDASTYTGSGSGNYAGLHTLSFRDTYPIGTDTWNQQVHVFIEDGVQVPLLLGPEATNESNLLPDLARYLLQRRGVPDALIDTDALIAAARFNRANGLLFNGVLVVPANLRDWLYRIAPFYLLRVSNRQGKIGLRPALPTNNDGTINTDPVSPVLTFTEDDIIPGSFQMEMVGVGERRPFTALMMWRDQPLDEVGTPRATEVRRAGVADDAPLEQFDLTEFCVTEDHAVKAAIYQHSRRFHIDHTLTVDVVPDPAVAALATGDILRVKYPVMVAGPGGGPVMHDFFYELDEVSTADDGGVTLQLTHFPVTDAGESVYALEVVRGVSVQEGFSWQASPAEYGNSIVWGGDGAQENLDDAKDPPIPYVGVASFSEPFIDVGAGTTLVRVCMDKPVQTQDMALKLVSELIAFNNQVINIGIGQQCGEIVVPTPTGPGTGTVGLLGYTGGGWVDPDLSDTITFGASALGFAAVVWTEEVTFTDDGQVASRTVTVRNAAGTDSATFSYDLPTYPVPEDTYFPGGNGSSWVQDGYYGYTWNCSDGGPPASFPLATRRSEVFGVDRDERGVAFCLPLSANSAVFVYRVRGAASFYYAKYQGVSTWRIPPWRAAQGSSLCANPDSSYAFTPDQIETSTLVTDYSVSPDEWAVTRCYVVTPTSVTEVTPPSGLVSALQQYEPTGYSLSLQSVGTYLPSGIRAVLEPPANNPLGWEGSASANDYYLGALGYNGLPPTTAARQHPGVSFSWGSAPTEAEYLIDNTFNYGDYFSQPISYNRLAPVGTAPSFWDFRESIPLLTCYGVGALASTYHSWSGSSPLYSPAMFTFLAEVNASLISDYADIYDYRNAMQATNADYTYIGWGYLFAAPVPTTFYAPCALSGSCPIDSPNGVNWADLPDSYVRFDEATVAPTSHDVALTVPDDFAAGTITIPLVGLGSLTGFWQVIYTWDWQQPDYCREQLIALGFDGADLTP